MRNFNEFTITNAVMDSLIGAFAEKPPGKADDGRMLERPYCHLHHAFRLRLDPARAATPADCLSA